MIRNTGHKFMLALIAGIMLFLPAANADFTVPIRAGSTIHFVWVGDLNGDGNMDYVVDRPWDAQQKIEAYTHNGTFLWDVDFGPNSVNKDNIEPGSATVDVGHWDGVTVSDLNNDGRAHGCSRVNRAQHGTQHNDCSRDKCTHDYSSSLSARPSPATAR